MTKSKNQSRAVQNCLAFDKTYRLEPHQKIVFDDYPLPPSSNSIYDHFTHPKTGKVTRVKSKKLVKYKKECETWAMVNNRHCKFAHKYLRDEPEIWVKVFVVFKPSSVYDKDGSTKKLDVSNRGKALLDCIADAIGIDDRHFAKVELIKCLSTSGREFCKIEFKPHGIEYM